MHKLHFGQTIKEIGPTWHNKKQGTPTMGGLCFIFASTVAVALATLSLLHSAPEMLGGPTARSLYIAMFSAFAFGMVGFLDDFIKVVKSATWACAPCRRSWRSCSSPPRCCSRCT